MAESKWTIDPSHSEISFRVKHLMISYVKGLFRSFDANVYTPDDKFKVAKVEFWMDPASIYTGDDKRDENLQGGEFFDVDNYKQITFSGIYGKSDDGEHELRGELTIKGISRPVVLEANFGGIMTDPWGNVKAGFAIKGKVNRRDWGLVWNAAMEKGGVFLGEEVLIDCHVELVKKAKRASGSEETAKEEMEGESIAAEE